MTDYFMVGTIYGGWQGDGAREMLDEWIVAGEWVLGWHGLESNPSYQRQRPTLALMDVGDVLIAKQMNNDFRTMLVKAIGRVTEPSTDGHRVGVDWVRDLRDAPVTLPTSYRRTLTKVSDSEPARRLLREHVLPLLADGRELI